MNPFGRVVYSKVKLNKKWGVKIYPLYPFSRKEKTEISIVKKLRRDVAGWPGLVSGIHTDLKEFEWKDNSKKNLFANFSR